jgi:hypothetical protein
MLLFIAKRGKRKGKRKTLCLRLRHIDEVNEVPGFTTI